MNHCNNLNSQLKTGQLSSIKGMAKNKALFLTQIDRINEKLCQR